MTNSGREYYIEFYVAGNSVKVSAVDSQTGLEAMVVGPLNAAKSDLQKLAIRKLELLLAKNNKL